MTRLQDLGSLPVILSNSLLSRSPLWRREVATLTPLDLSSFVARYRGTPAYFDAIAEANVVVDAGIEALMSGAINSAEFIHFRAPKAVTLVSDVVEWLSRVSLIRCKAILFALETELSPRFVMELSWKGLSRLTLSNLAVEVVRSMPRHIRLDYVFWDILPNGAVGPLFGLTESAMECADGLGFEKMLERYKNMVMIDSDADLKHFLSNFNAELDRRMNQ